MNHKEYVDIQTKVLKVCKEIRYIHGLGEFLEEIDRSETTAPIVDPTMYRASLKNLAIIKKSARLIKDVQDNLPGFQEILDGHADATNYKETHGRNA